jgi:hypothetical protein
VHQDGGGALSIVALNEMVLAATKLAVPLLDQCDAAAAADDADDGMDVDDA